MFATGENYAIGKVKKGVKYLRDILSGGLGIHDINASSIYASLGHRVFTVMMKSVFEQDLGGDSLDNFLLEARNNARTDGERKRNRAKHETHDTLKGLGDEMKDDQKAEFSPLQVKEVNCVCVLINNIMLKSSASWRV